MQLQQEIAEARAERLQSKDRAPITEIKVDINNLLHRYMPPSTTLGDLDDFATAILAIIETRWNCESEPAPR